MEILHMYPPHITYLLLYALVLLFALLTIIWRIGQRKARWGSLINFFVLLAGVGGMFALGYHALDGFQNAREFGIAVLVLFLLTGLWFSKNINSRKEPVK